MSPYEAVLLLVVCANAVTSAFMLWKLTDLDRELSAFLAKYYKRKAAPK